MDLFYLFKDINFQKGFLLVAALILVMVLLNVAYKLSKTDALEAEGWPPKIAPCPDYWDLSGNYCINTNGQNLGNVSGNTLWSSGSVNCIANDPYTSASPVICNDKILRVINADTMYVNDTTQTRIGAPQIPIRQKRTKQSRTKWANKYGFIWDGLTSNGPKS